MILPPLRVDVRTLAAAFTSPPVTRFAPSPTGFLHLGHVVNAIYVWGIAGALGGRVLLRVEDHDRIRCRAEFDRALIEDLTWLGFEPHEGIASLRRQSDRTAIYDAALDRLRTVAHVYACECSRREIGGERYTGRCRARGLDVTGRGVRVELGPHSESFDDGLLGRLTQNPLEQCGDILIRDRDGHWTYQFAVCVDDLEQGVTLVIRGADLVSSTGRQIALGRLLGRAAPPLFLHHPLIYQPGGEKLSKSAGDTGVRELRAAGMSAPDVIGTAAARVGLLDRPAPVSASDVAKLFQPPSVGSFAR